MFISQILNVENKTNFISSSIFLHFSIFLTLVEFIPAQLNAGDVYLTFGYFT